MQFEKGGPLQLRVINEIDSFVNSNHLLGRVVQNKKKKSIKQWHMVIYSITLHV